MNLNDLERLKTFSFRGGFYFNKFTEVHFSSKNFPLFMTFAGNLNIAQALHTST